MLEHGRPSPPSACALCVCAWLRARARAGRQASPSPRRASCLLQINPGEVKVLRGRAQHTLYSDGTGSDNPYDEKLKIKIEPTRLAVKVDPVQHIPQSPVSSHGAQSLHGTDAFGAFRHASGLSAAMGSQSQSPTESPMPSWRASTVAPPAITPLPPHMGANGGYGGFNQGFGADQGYCGFDGGMGSMGLGGFGSNGLAPQGQQGGGVPHSSPMRGYGSYAPQSSYGHTPQQPVF